jgi:hypothetical protein
MPMSDKEKTAFEQLSIKHQLFVMNYCKHLGNATRAYMDTYTSAKYESAMTKGSELYRNVKVKAAIDEKYAETFKEIQSEAEKSKTYEMIKAMGNFTIDNVLDWDEDDVRLKLVEEMEPGTVHIIQSIKKKKKQTKDGYEEEIDVKLVPKLQALKMRAEMQGLMDSDDKTGVEIIIKPGIRPSENKDDKEKE